MNANRWSRCLPDGSYKGEFEWQKWNIDKTQSHKSAAWLKMCWDRWQLISWVAMVSSLEEVFPADPYSDLFWLYPETWSASVNLLPTPPQLHHHCKLDSSVRNLHWDINLQQYLQIFLHFHYQQDLFMCFPKWLCCYRLFSESLSLPRGWSRQFQELCFPFGAVLGSGARWWLIEGFGGFVGKRHKERSDLGQKAKTTARFTASVSVINVS